jgi:hypothetical protein
MKPGPFKRLELTAEFGINMENYFRELNKVNITFHL